MTLIEMVNSDMIWNKEKIQVVIEDGEGKWIRSKIDRIEFLMWEYQDYEVDWFESGEGIYNNEKISIIIFHVSKDEKSIIISEVWRLWHE